MVVLPSRHEFRKRDVVNYSDHGAFGVIRVVFRHGLITLRDLLDLGQINLYGLLELVLYSTATRRWTI